MIFKLIMKLITFFNFRLTLLPYQRCFTSLESRNSQSPSRLPIRTDCTVCIKCLLWPLMSPVSSRRFHSKIGMPDRIQRSLWIIIFLVPAIMGGSFGEEMTFFQRAYNLFNTLAYIRFNYFPMEQYRKMFESNYPGFPDIQVCWVSLVYGSVFEMRSEKKENFEELMALNSLYFLNSDPLIDFPRPSAARVIDIGGMAVSNGFNKLDQVRIRTFHFMK